MKNKFLFQVLLLTTYHLPLTTLIDAVPPPPGFIIPSEKTCKVNPVEMKSRLGVIKAAPFFPVPLNPTTAYVLVIRIDFSDKTMTKTRAETEQFMELMKSYYMENSYGILTVSATVTSRTAGGTAGSQGAYRMPDTLALYAQGICSNFDQIAKDAVEGADTDYNFSNGAPGGNRFNHIMVYHAGIGAETANDTGCQTDNIWSVFAPTVAAGAPPTEGVNNPFLADGVFFNGVTIVPESEGQGIDPLGVICHEYGHQLGLPDLYKTSAQSVVGRWSSMDSGIYIGSPAGVNPAHLDAWSKQFLGFFSKPQIVVPLEASSNIALAYAATAPNSFLRVPIAGIPGVDGNKEYFLVERRAGSALTGKKYDDALPLGTMPEGYLIWHIDDSVAMDETRLQNNSVNSGFPNFGIDLVESDGTGGIITTNGKDSDPFPGTKGKTLFATPLSNSYNGQQTGIALAGFSGGKIVSKKAFAADTVDVSKTINFPNPGGPSYIQRSGASANTITTIVLHTTRPPKEFKLTIHDLSGLLVRDVPENMISANGTATSTNKFVFEYDWDGKNDDGEAVSSGVYLYRFKADDVAVKTGKLVLVR